MPVNAWRTLRQVLDESGTQPVNPDRIRCMVNRLRIPEAEHDSFIRSVHGLSVEVALMRQRRHFAQARHRLHEAMTELEQLDESGIPHYTTFGQHDAFDGGAEGGEGAP